MIIPSSHSNETPCSCSISHASFDRESDVEGGGSRRIDAMWEEKRMLQKAVLRLSPPLPEDLRLV